MLKHCSHAVVLSRPKGHLFYSLRLNSKNLVNLYYTPLVIARSVTCHLLFSYSIILNVSDSFLEYLHADGIVLPDG